MDAGRKSLELQKRGYTIQPMMVELGFVVNVDNMNLKQKSV